ncbi:MAG: type II toxin-antitoxin system RelE/ParE family toxin [Cyanobacteria bacterium J06634_6]
MSRRIWELRRYIDKSGSRPFEKWFSTLDKKTQVRVSARLDRIVSGNFGDFKSVGKGVYELRLFFGSGYRIYYALLDRRVVLLLAGGDKKDQSKDINKAQRYLSDHKES